MNQIADIVAGNVTVIGKTSSERKASVVHIAGSAAVMALTATKGAVGKIAQRRTAINGLNHIANQCSHNNYAAIAEYIAAKTGASCVVSNRASFLSLPDRFEEMIRTAKMGKNGGYVVDKKTGADKPGAKLALALELHAMAIEMIALSTEMYESRKADKVALGAETAVAA